MKDAWTAFTQGAEGREAVGYFEAAPRPGSPTGRAVSFLSASEIRTITPRASPQEEGRHVERFLRERAGRAAMGFLGFDGVGLFEPRLRAFPGRGPLSTRDVRARGSPYPRSCRSAGAPEGGPLRTRRGQAPPRLAPTSRAYARSVVRLVQEIRNGEAYQVVLAHHRTWRRPKDLIDRAGRLRDSERYAFFYYLPVRRLRDRGGLPRIGRRGRGRPCLP